MDSRRSFLRGLFAFCLVAMVSFGLEFYGEWVRLGKPGLADMNWADVNNAKLVDVLSPMARAYNNILAMLLATIGLAIPLTANMHTPKLIEMFLRDRVNRIMLGFCALGAAHVLWVDYLIGPKFAPIWAYRLAVLGTLLGWLALIPYFFYVVRFVDPSNILRRLQIEITQEVEGVRKSRIDPQAAHALIHERLQQIGTLILKSIDRADRSVALEGIWTMKCILDYYGVRKAEMPEPWFRVDRKDFIGLAAEALALVNERHIWFEHKVLSQLFLAYQNALGKAQDVIPSVSDATRVIAVHAAGRKDQWALDLAIKFFNNYLREAIKRKDIHAVYDVFYQYRVLASEELRDQPDVVREIGRRFCSYCDYAQANGLPYVSVIAGFDLGWMVCRAYDNQSPAAADLLDQMLLLKCKAGPEAAFLALKAQLILGGYLQGKGLKAEAAQVRKNLGDVPEAQLAAAERDLLSLAEPAFWEVTSRQVNFEWVAPEQRPHVQSFVASLRQEERHAEVR